ncbi:MAG: hypothetical protein U5K72_11230 [Balneolaceae bacterium]|nr:hypothetical protein [Balneolaceae bacterium]
MRIDPKYFNRFIGICAAITVVVIIYSTIRYFHNQVTEFQNNVSNVQADTLSFRSFSEQDSLFVADLPAEPTIIHFWSTWSDKSKEVGEYLQRYREENALIVIAAAVRDGDEQVQNYIRNQALAFHFVEGTDLFQSLMAPGLPTQIFIDRRKQIFDTHVGNDTTEIKTKLVRLLDSE